MPKQLPLFEDPKNVHAISPDRLRRLCDWYHWTPAAEVVLVSDVQIMKDALPAFEGAPPKLLDTVHMIADLSTREALDALQAAIPERQPAWLEDCLSPADGVTEIWFRYPHLVEREHARRQLRRPRKFEYFQTLADARNSARPPTESDIKILASRLDRECAARLRGQGANVLEFLQDDAWSFVIWHGECVKQDLHWDNGTVRRIDYRPVGVDIVVYQPTCCELRISARAEWQKRLYREAFGQLLLGDEQAFPGTSKFTVDPILKDRRAAVNCVDLPGIEYIDLTAVEYLYPGPGGLTGGLKGPGLATDPRFQIPPLARLIRVRFDIKLRGHKKARRVEIRPFNIATYDRDADSVWIDRWLELRGFVLVRNRHDDESKPFLAVA